MFEETRQWYGGNIPPFGSPAFVDCLIDTAITARYIADTDDPIVIRLRDQGTACVSRSDQTAIIELPYWVLEPDVWDKLPVAIENINKSDYGLAVISMFKGFLVHEASHIRYSPFGLSAVDALEHANLPAIPDQTNFQLFNAAYQIVEDLFIDHEALKKPYGIFTQSYLDMLFSSGEFQRRITEYAARRETDTTINLMSVYKNPKHRNDDIWNVLPDGIVSRMDAALTQPDTHMRTRLAYEIYELLRQNVPESPSIENQLHDFTSALDKKAPSRLPNNEEVESATLTPYEETVSKFEDFETVVNEFLNDNDAALEKEVPPVVVMDVMAHDDKIFDSEYGDARPASAFKAFGRILRQLRSKNFTPGQPMDHGPRIVNTRLVRIATDQKIFGLPEERRTKDQREVMILINASGSIKSHYQEVLEAAYGAFLGIKDSMIPCSVYAHTTTGYGSGFMRSAKIKPLLVQIATTQSINARARFDKAVRLGHHESYDGLILKELGKRFARRGDQKVLIILEDGQPNCSPLYQGESALEHTKRAVEALRKEGIIVVVCSITRSVLKANDTIYGKEYNIDCTKNLESQLQRILIQYVL